MICGDQPEESGKMGRQFFISKYFAPVTSSSIKLDSFDQTFTNESRTP